MAKLRKAKIVATLGPACDDDERLAEIIRGGVDVVRLNFSHGSHEEHQERFQRVRRVASAVGKPVAVLADLSGPKIRIGQVTGGEVTLVEDAILELVTGSFESTAERVCHTYSSMAADVEPGQLIFLDDGQLQLMVEEITNEPAVRCRVIVGGPLRSKKGINLPQSSLSAPALTDKDRSDLIFARAMGVDYFALSFVRRPEDLVEAKRLAGRIPVIAKIERPEAVERLLEILDVADGVMVARGDLGVEIGHERVPAVQKRIIREAVRRAIPVITATQMLDSMIRSPQPTRAEVSDVANAVLDGTDAVMLSGETAIGKYPLEAVQIMAAIIRETEQSVDHEGGLRSLPEGRRIGFSAAIAQAAVTAAEVADVKAIAAYSESGSSAADVACLRPKADVIAFSRHEHVLRRLALLWGVRPLFGAWVKGVTGVVEQAERELLRYQLVSPGDSIIVTFCIQLNDDEPFETNMMKLRKVHRPSLGG